MQMRNAARVLPDPVGAEIKTLRPASISGQPCTCGSVACGKRAANQSATRGTTGESGILQLTSIIAPFRRRVQLRQAILRLKAMPIPARYEKGVFRPLQD